MKRWQKLFEKIWFESVDHEIISSISTWFNWHWDDLLEVNEFRSILSWVGRSRCDSVEIERFQSTLRWISRDSTNIIKFHTIELKMKRWSMSWDDVVRIKKNEEIFRWLFEKMLLGRDVDDLIGIRMILSRCRWFGRN